MHILYHSLKRLCLVMGLWGLLGFENASYAVTTIKINPKATFLHTNNDLGAINAIPIDLNSVGLSAGDTILLEQLGNFSIGPSADTYKNTIGVFSSSPTLAAASNLHRVPGAIDTGIDVVTGNTYFGNQPTDIPEDFRIVDTGTLITIPTGALYLFVAASDSLYQDNTDPDGNYYVRISLAPLADAGNDQTFNEGDLITLDGSGSKGDPSRSLSYYWQQIAGEPVVSLDLTDPQKPKFTAPNVARTGVTLTFQLIVNDSYSDSQADTVNISIKNVNHPPVAEAGTDQTVQEGSLVILNGSNSYDPDNDTLTFHWEQIEGNSVSLIDATTVQANFTAPVVGSSGDTLKFQLSVDDGIASNTDIVLVKVENVNHAPIANAGDDFTVEEGRMVMLDGRGSIDPDNDLLSYTWTALNGPLIALSDPSSPTPSFQAPHVEEGGSDIEFELMISDGSLTSTDKVIVHIMDANDPPVCELALASPALIWPPNKKMITVKINNVSDPDNEEVIIKILNVAQDESSNELGSNNFISDAVIQGQDLLLRAERAGDGNGRIYEITFSAQDNSGKSCIGKVNVCIPHTPSLGRCIDDGFRFPSQ